MFAKLFGKKPEQTENKKFFPENRLEALLMQAANDPGTRPEFYKCLLESDVYVLVFSGGRPDGRHVYEEGSTISIKGMVVEDKKFIPVFTAERRLREHIRGNDTQAKINGHTLFSMIASNNQDGILLNPGSNYGKEFTKEEVASLADGSIFQSNLQVISKATQILIGMPQEYPEKTVKALSSYFQGKPEIKKAYFAQIHDPDSGEPPHLLFAIESTGDFASVAADLNLIFRDTFETGQFADVMQIGQRKGNLDDYFKDQKPFFEQST